MSGGFENRQGHGGCRGGPEPVLHRHGRAYLTGPYKGAPYGIAIVVPAIAGPFNLGNVVVRSSIFVDKHTAELRVVSDPLPRILEGIPLDVRDVRVSVDRPDFTLNPTSCAKKTISGVLDLDRGQDGQRVVQIPGGDCARSAVQAEIRPVGWWCGSYGEKRDGGTERRRCRCRREAPISDL